jgi:hypothetical protein
MKRLLSVVPVVFAMLVLITPGWANAPVLEIDPVDGSTIFVAGFPVSIDITSKITHSPLSSVNAFDVQESGVSILPLGALGNPFPSNLCSVAQMDAAHGVSSCSVSGDTGTVVTPWTVTGPGLYSLSIEARHQGNEGTDEADVSVLLLNVEYPAPPAVANAYINSLALALRKLFVSGVRGCVISQIAENHAKVEKYGPKGGPYNTALIQSDVRAYGPACGGPTL